MTIRFLLVIVMSVSLISLMGCFAQQRNQINAVADHHLQLLDQQCKENMTDWCRIQYQLIERDRERKLDEVSSAQENFSRSMRSIGNQGKECSCYNIGARANCSCN